MAQIRLLDQATVNKIAAGEVVERPASIVKELLENAVDAGASRITVEIKEGGIAYIRITDNGCGIEADQIRMAFLRHSTSKIRSVEDLASSLTLGFRGEALASIAAVARVEILSKTAEALVGIRYIIEGGQEKLWEEVACPVGTTLKVENLFFNTPARRKFLKKPQSEGATITELMQKMALAHPEIALRYFNGKKKETAIHTPGGGDLKQCVYAVYGREVLDKMLPLTAEKTLDSGEMVTLSGYIGRPQMLRASRSYENFFINGRYIRSGLLEKAVLEAYKDYVEPGRFPAIVLHLSVDPAALDVNVHPTKMEVRFMQAGAIYRAVYEAVSECLDQGDLISRVGSFYKEETALPIPTAPEAAEKALPAERKEERQAEEAKPPLTYYLPETPKRPAGKTPFIVEERDERPPQAAAPEIWQGEQIKVYEEAPVAPPVVSLQEEAASYQGTATEKQPHHLRLIGQIFRTYWLAEEGDIFYIIDQHAAHERVLYDRFRQLLQEEKMASQGLIEPVVCTVSPGAVAELENYQPLLQKTGFEVEPFGEDAVIVRGVPFILNSTLPPEDLGIMLDMVHSGSVDTARDLLIDKIAMMSCKAAVKGNMNLSEKEAQDLVDQLFSSANPYNCPHGRPTVISMTQYEVEKRFKRV